MKRTMPWSDSDDEDDGSSSGESSTHDTDTEGNDGSSKKNTRIRRSSKEKTSEGNVTPPLSFD